jgi:hypothetical protein
VLIVKPLIQEVLEEKKILLEMTYCHFGIYSFKYFFTLIDCYVEFFNESGDRGNGIM